MAALSFNVHSATTFALISFIYNINALRGFFMCGFFFSSSFLESWCFLKSKDRTDRDLTVRTPYEFIKLIPSISLALISRKRTRRFSRPFTLATVLKALQENSPHVWQHHQVPSEPLQEFWKDMDPRKMSSQGKAEHHNRGNNYTSLSMGSHQFKPKLDTSSLQLWRSHLCLVFLSPVVHLLSQGFRLDTE